MFLLSNNHLWSSSFKKYHHFSVFSVFIFSPILTYWAISQLYDSVQKSHYNKKFLYWPCLTFSRVWIFSSPHLLNRVRFELLIIIWYFTDGSKCMYILYLLIKNISAHNLSPLRIYLDRSLFWPNFKYLIWFRMLYA